MRWQKLQQDFMALVKKEDGPMKSSCGTVGVYFGSPYYPNVMVIFGGYCIGDWSREEKIGPFDTEDEAYEAAVQKLEEARLLVKEELEDF